MNDSKEELDYKNVLLDPDHPLLEAFQKALKEHLQNQIFRLKEEIYEIETDAKKKEAEIVDVGVRAYEAQQQICVQQKTLESKMKEIETVTAAQEREEMALEKNTKTLKTLQNKLFQTEKANREMVSEIEGLSSLNQQLNQSETKIESHININKRIAEKTRQENQKLSKEKRRQDYIIHQLVSEVWRLENEIETCKLQMSVQQEELDAMEQKIAIGNTNVSALEAELRGLVYSWNTVVVAVCHRDKGLECLTNELNKIEEKHKNVLSEIENAKKLIRKEQVDNEKFTLLKDRVLYDINTSRTQYEDLMNQKQALDAQYCEVQSHMEQIESDIKKCQLERHRKQIAYNYLADDYEKLSTKKLSIEEEILHCIESEIVNSQMGKKVKKMLNDVAAKKRDVEVVLGEAENRKSLLHSEIESQKFKIDELNKMNQETKDQMGEMEALASKLKSEKEKFELLYRKREKQVQTLNQKLEEKLGLADLDKVARAEMKITELTKLIEEIQQENKNLQVFWMREQKSLIGVSNERQEQIHNISVLRKQVLVLEQKNVRIRDEIEELKKREEKTQHSINMLTNKATILCDSVFKKKTKKTHLGRNNALLQGEYEMNLKDAELLLLQIESEIAEIEEDKLTLSKELVEINREGLEWEKKFQMTKEAVTNLRGNKNSEVSGMKAEVHKMEVIFAQLKKAQDKLLRDMERCIFRRDTLFYQSDARQEFEKKKKVGDRIRINFHRKLDNMKNQIKQAKNEIATNKKKYKSALAKIDELNKELVETYKAPVFDKDYKNNLKLSLEEAKINRQLKFELLVFQQKKANMYSMLTKNRTPFVLYKKEEDLINEYQKEKNINSKLIQITENIKLDFPNRESEIVKLRNTLGIVALCMYT